MIDSALGGLHRPWWDDDDMKFEDHGARSDGYTICASLLLPVNTLVKPPPIATQTHFATHALKVPKTTTPPLASNPIQISFEKEAQRGSSKTKSPQIRGSRAFLEFVSIPLY